MKFQHINLGQVVLKYQVPYDILISLNTIYQNEFKNLPPANKTLVGKIQNEHSVFYNGDDTKDIKGHNFLPYDILKWFEDVYKHYLDFNQIINYNLHINSIWINEMKEHEYNPIHIHQGTIYTGLSSVMMLKLPKDILNQLNNSGAEVVQTENLEEGISEVDIIYVTRVQEERFNNKQENENRK